VYFALTELEHHPILFEVTYDPGEITFPEEFRQRGPLQSEGQAELLRNTLGEIRVRGHIKVDIETECDRCLEPAIQSIDSDFDLFYRPAIKSGAHGEIHLEEGEIDLAFYQGDGIALRDALREQILLSLPMQRFCRPDCKGLCPTCGANRNDAPCSCELPQKNARWTALKDLQ